MQPRKPGSTRVGHGRAQIAAFKRYFSGLPVIEARTPLRFFPIQADKDGAIPRDPRNCVLSCAARRQFGATAVLFFRSVAYVDLEQADGTRAVERFTLGDGAAAKARRYIEAFDKGEPLPNGGVYLGVPTASATLEGELAQRHKAAARKRAALLKGERVGTSRKGKKYGIVGAGRGGNGVRNGTGMVQFVRHKSA